MAPEAKQRTITWSLHIHYKFGGPGWAKLGCWSRAKDPNNFHGNDFSQVGMVVISTSVNIVCHPILKPLSGSLKIGTTTTEPYVQVQKKYIWQVFNAKFHLSTSQSYVVRLHF